MKTFKAKSSAVRAAKKEFGTNWAEQGVLVENGGLWGFEPRPNKGDQDLLDQTGFVNCPHCQVHLSNGVDGYDYAIEDHDPKRVAWAKSMKLRFNCMGCNEEFGPKVEAKENKKVYANHSLIAKPCAVVWDIAEKMGIDAKRKDVLIACEKAGVTFYTARTQYQKYKEALRGDVK